MSALRDMLALDIWNARRLLSPMPVPMPIGMGGLPRARGCPECIVCNGTVFGVSTPSLSELGDVRFGDTTALLAA